MEELKDLAKEPSANENQEGSFAEMLEQFEREQAHAAVPRESSHAARAGKVAGITDDYVMIDFGAKAEGVIPLEEFRDKEGHVTAKAGDPIDVVVTGRNQEGLVTLSRVTGPRPRDWDALEHAWREKETIVGRVTGTTKGGFTVDVGLRAFMPASRSGARDAAEMENLVDQEIRCRVIKFERADQNVVVDRRLVLEEDARRARQSLLETLEEGQVVRGTVRTITDFGAFVDLGGVDGLLHMSDMSWSRSIDPRTELQVGDSLDLKVLKVNHNTGKISLGLKQMYPDPWETVARELQAGERVRGTVTRLADFGAFVEVRPGVEGLIHVSEMSWTRRVRKPSDLLKAGDEVEAVILKVDPAARRLGLGLKQALGNPWETIAQRYPVGSVVDGKIVRLAKFGAFAEVEEGIDGLIHVSDITSERRVEHPNEFLKVGQDVRAIVLESDVEKRRLKLGLKQLQPTTIDDYLREHQRGDRVMGRVVSIGGEEATVQLGEGVEGVCLLRESEAPVAKGPARETAVERQPGAKPPRGTLAEALAAVWKGPMPAKQVAALPEPLREGQLRSFVIHRLDPDARRIELLAV